MGGIFPGELRNLGVDTEISQTSMGNIVQDHHEVVKETAL